MGFRLGRIYVLDFDGTGLQGAEIRLHSPTIDVTDRLPQVDRDAQWQMCLDHLESWNLETKAGDPLKPELAEVKANMEPAVMNLIVKYWYYAARGVKGVAPLEPESSAGVPSPEGESEEPLIPMELL